MTLHPVHGRVRFLAEFPLEDVMHDLWRVGIWPVIALWCAAIWRIVA